jgi:hypothetical protein
MWVDQCFWPHETHKKKPWGGHALILTNKLSCLIKGLNGNDNKSYN